MLNMPGIDALNVGALVVPKLIAGVVAGAEKLKPVVAGFDAVGAALLFELLPLPLKEKPATGCWGGFWFAPKMNLPAGLLFALPVLPEPNTVVDTFDVANGEA